MFAAFALAAERMNEWVKEKKVFQKWRFITKCSKSTSHIAQLSELGITLFSCILLCYPLLHPCPSPAPERSSHPHSLLQWGPGVGVDISLGTQTGILHLPVAPLYLEMSHQLFGLMHAFAIFMPLYKSFCKSEVGSRHTRPPFFAKLRLCIEEAL